MGLLVQGQWRDQWYDTSKSGGRFQRTVTSFRDTVAPDSAHPPEAGRYRLYVAAACPWAHRTLLMRTLKGLDEVLEVSTVQPLMLEDGWTFSEPEPELGKTKMHELYTAAAPDYTGRVTVPVLWDRARQVIVNNESAELIRLLNHAFDGLTGNDLDFWPEDLRETIEAINEPVYHHVNNGVYKAGFATSQAAYTEAVTALFDQLDALEALLAQQPFLAGDHLTEADLRLVTTLFRFDLVYVTHFKCDRRRIVDYPNLWAYTRQLYQMPGVAETFDAQAVREHYFRSHRSVNPHAILSIGPELDFMAPHGRGEALATVRRHVR